MTATSADIAVVGAGPAGLIAAAAFAATGASVIVIDPHTPITSGNDAQADRRSTAFLQPAIRLFETTGLWDDMAKDAVALQGLRIVDLVGDPPALRDERLFKSDDLGDRPFGWNFMNWQIRASLMAYLSGQKNVTLRFGAGLQRLVTRTGDARLTLTNGERIICKLAIAMDGRNSTLRDLAGIGVNTTRYGQQSLAFTATHDIPHQNISTEIYHHGGPFTMVPLPEIDGHRSSAIVWMNEGPRAQELKALPADEFDAEMGRRTAGLFGNVRVASPRAAFPIITRRADRLVGQRVAVLGEAAHVLPPIGAQGLNTSVNDIACLGDLIAGSSDPGAPEVLAAYEQTRLPDITRRGRVIDLFNRVTRSGLPPLQDIRLMGLKAVHDIAPLRTRVMQMGMGPKSGVPSD